jgi:thymidylate kinase
VTFLGLTNAAAQARIAVHVVRGRIVICDRYSLDSAVHLLHRYGDTRAVRSQIALISLLSPPARRAYLLEVAPEVALRRKADRWTLDQLRRRFHLYRELQDAFGAQRLNAEQPQAQLAAEIARDVWASIR